MPGRDREFAATPQTVKRHWAILRNGHRSAAQPKARREGVRRSPFVVRQVGILGCGSHLPERLLTNVELERMVETSDDWIVARTGMKERHLAAAGEATSDLATAAGRRALANAGLAPEDVDLVVVATTTPDHYCSPSTAAIVQHKLGLTRAGAFDVNAACTSFVTALSAAHAMVAAGTVRNALVIGAEKLSTVVDYTDRETCVLFGDGAGAFVLGTDAAQGELLDHLLGADGSGAELIQVPAGGSASPARADTVTASRHFIQLRGRQVFRFAVAKMAEVVEELLVRHGASLDDLDLLIPHQANLRIIEAAAERLRLPMERVFVNVERTGNTSAASVPLALDEAMQTGRLKKGALVCLVAFGGGLTWGGSLLRW
ncbi:MAG: ketoacyl-ACP synthase III [Planctomycetes bacterium]|nr:ketoacyl-ACP synthase III [Planctomycetota bacterium]